MINLFLFLCFMWIMVIIMIVAGGIIYLVERIFDKEE